MIYLDANSPDMLTATVRLVFNLGPLYWTIKLQNGWGQGRDGAIVRLFAKFSIYPEY